MATNPAQTSDLPTLIASAIMDTIEREQRINKDDLILAVETCLAREKKRVEAQHPVWIRNDGEVFKGIASHYASANAENAKALEKARAEVQYVAWGDLAGVPPSPPARYGVSISSTDELTEAIKRIEAQLRSPAEVMVAPEKTRNAVASGWLTKSGFEWY